MYRMLAWNWPTGAGIACLKKAIVFPPRLTFSTLMVVEKKACRAEVGLGNFSDMKILHFPIRKKGAIFHI